MGWWQRFKEWFGVEDEDPFILEKYKDVDWDDLYDVEREAIKQESMDFQDASKDADTDIELDFDI